MAFNAIMSWGEDAEVAAPADDQGEEAALTGKVGEVEPSDVATLAAYKREGRRLVRKWGRARPPEARSQSRGVEGKDGRERGGRGRQPGEWQN